jgi:hypothetical protein
MLQRVHAAKTLAATLMADIETDVGFMVLPDVYCASQPCT